VAALKDPETKALLEKQATQTVGNSPDAFARFVRQDIAAWITAADQANIEVRQVGAPVGRAIVVSSFGRHGVRHLGLRNRKAADAVFAHRVESGRHRRIGECDRGCYA